ncbi:tetratricopeptide repeat-containing sulfotransferase family protein [Salipiger abyssi]|uniref:Tetratricopeptide repeat protein n=1 Tax=Salipiger abyssi TaxID=1250539 RepID=A0A1P8UZX9_9RHOB|nr:sulfotransferase [Salipiger abyssi]APZ54935.1 tetratricopeptide repeat protein [Salipiger abyssi]
MSSSAKDRPAPDAAQALAQANALISAQRKPEAAALLRGLLARSSDNAEARRRLAALGAAAHPAPRLTAAETRERKAIGTALRARDWQAVLPRAQALLKRQPLLGDVANALGLALRATGRNNDALRAFDHAIRTDPALPDSYVNMSMLLRSLSQPAAARDAALAGLDVAPGNAGVRMAAGLALLELEDADRAIIHLREATRSAPGDVLAWDALLRALDLANRNDEAADALDAAEAACPGAPMIALHRAARDLREDRAEDALTLLDAQDPTALPPETRGVREQLRGRALDKLDRPAEAFAAFDEMNAHRLRARPAVGGPQFHGAIQHKLAGLDALPAGSWPADAAETDGWQPVFMVGFPRSGTTLADTFLRGHPDILLTEERPFSQTLTRGIDPAREAHDLATLGTEERAARRAAYRVRFETDLGQQVGNRSAIDRLPFNMLNAAAIARMFPGAKFILVLRHPCDVVLSCFMQNFTANEAMDRFLDLSEAAETYDRSFTLWQRYRDRLELDVTELRYEDMIADPARAFAPVMAALGRDWRTDMADHRRAAQSRAVIQTASYAQVTRGLYRDAENRWQRYRDQLAPVMDRLTPWMETLGYSGRAQ